MVASHSQTLWSFWVGNVIPKNGKPVEDMEPLESSELIETVFQVLASVASYQNSLFNERKGHYIYE